MLSGLTPVEPSTIADAVAAKLREAIITGVFAPGQKLAEPALAESLGVSRSPVREALLRLEGEGLVRGQRNQSCYVWQPTEADVEEILSLRIMLEALAAEWAMHQLDAQDFAHLETILARTEAAIHAGEHLRVVEEDRNFHEYIILRAGHTRLLAWWKQIISQWEVLIYRRLQNDPTVVHTVLSDHQVLLDALRSRDLERVVGAHRSINARVSAETKQALRLQRVGQPA